MNLSAASILSVSVGAPSSRSASSLLYPYSHLCWERWLSLCPEREVRILHLECPSTPAAVPVKEGRLEVLTYPRDAPSLLHHQIVYLLYTYLIDIHPLQISYLWRKESWNRLLEEDSPATPL